MEEWEMEEVRGALESFGVKASAKDAFGVEVGTPIS